MVVFNCPLDVRLKKNRLPKRAIRDAPTIIRSPTTLDLKWHSVVRGRASPKRASSIDSGADLLSSSQLREGTPGQTQRELDPARSLSSFHFCFSLLLLQFHWLSCRQCPYQAVLLLSSLVVVWTVVASLNPLPPPFYPFSVLRESPFYSSWPLLQRLPRPLALPM